MREEEATELIVSLFDSWYSTLVRYGARFTRSTDLAEDAVQEALMLLYRDLRLGKRVDNPKGWTLVVVRRQALRLAALSAREEQIEDLEALPLEAGKVEIQDPRFDHAARLFSVLSERERVVIYLRLAALKYREIGAEMGISLGSVNKLVARALRKLQKAAARKSGDGDSTTNEVRPATRKTLQ